MLKIPLFVLVIQIGFNVALNNRGYSGKLLIPIARLGNSEPTRRLAGPDPYLLSRSSSSNEMPEPEYDSFEDDSFRSSFQPVQYSYQRRNNDLRYSSKLENAVSLETAPVGRINSNNYAESVPSSSSPSRRSYPNYRRPYSARGPTNLGQVQTRKYNKKKNDDSSVEVSSLEDLEETSQEEADSILSFFEKSSSRTGQNRKYYRKGHSLSDDASPIDKLDDDEHAVHTPNSQNKRRNYHKKYSNQYNLRAGGLKSRTLTRSSLRDVLSPGNDKTGQLTFLRLSSLEDLNLESPFLRSHDQTGLNNRKGNSRKFLRLSLSPKNKLTLDEGVASDLSELLSGALDKLNLVPLSLRRIGPSRNKYSRRENRLSTKEDDLNNSDDLRLESLENLNSESPTRRYGEHAYRSSKNNLSRHGNNRAAHKKQFDEDTAKTLVPYHEGNRKKLPNSRRNENQNNNRSDDFSDEFSLDTLFDFKKEGHDEKLNLDDNLSSDLSVLHSTNQDNLSFKSSVLRSSDENESKPTTDLLNLENHWIDVLDPKNKTKTKSLKSQTQLRNSEQEDKTKDSFDPLHLEFPWNDELSPGSNKSGKSKSNLRSPEQKDDKKDITHVLHLEYPWNSQLSPNNNKTSEKSGLRSQSLLSSPKTEDNVKDTTDTLHLEFPLNDELSPDENKTGKSKSFRRQTDNRQEKEPKYELQLELPWNGKANLNKPSSKETAAHIPDPFYIHPYLRNRNIKKHSNYFRRSYDDFSEGVRLKNRKNGPLKRSNRRLKDSNIVRVRPIARIGPENHKNYSDKDSDSDSVENPSAVITFPSDRLHKRLRVRTRRQNNESLALVTTTERPNNTDSFVKNESDKKV